MSKFIQCSYRRLLSDHQTWTVATALMSRTYHTRPSSPHQPLSVKMKIKDRRSALISAPPEERRIDRDAREAFTNALHDVLKHKSVHGLTDRGDSYISVKELLNYQNFRMLSFSNLQKVVNEDRLHRFEMLYQPLKGTESDSWWIRVKEEEEKDTKLDPIIYSDNVGVAIYGTTLRDWRSYISLKGIPRRNDNYIQISQWVPVQDYLASSISTQVLIYINIRRAVDMGIRFFLSSRPSSFSAPLMPSLHQSSASGRGASSLASHSSTMRSSPPSRTPRSDHQIQPPSLTKSPTAITYKNRSTQILTPGNEFGFLPPECFTKVEVVRIKRKLLWPSDDAGEMQESDDGEGNMVLDSDMAVKKQMTVTRPERQHRTKISERALDQFFIDLPNDHQTREVHPDLKKEALAIFST